VAPRLALGRDTGVAFVLAFALLCLVRFLLPKDPPLWLASVASEGAFIGAAVLAVAVGRADVRDAFSLRGAGARLWLAALVGTIGAHFVLREAAPALQEALRWMRLDYGAELAEWEAMVEREVRRNPAAAYAAICLLPALCEEALFRGVALSGLRRSIGAPAALVVTALLFGLIHVLPLRILLTFVLGLWFGALVLATRSLWPAVFAHLANNAMALAIDDDGAFTPWTFAAGAALAAAGVAILVRARVRDQAGGLGEKKSGDGGSAGASV